MARPVRWRPVLAAVLGAVAVSAAAVGGLQVVAPDARPGVVEPTRRPALPGSTDPDAVVPPVGATVRPPVFAPSAVVTSPAAVPVGSPETGVPPGGAQRPRPSPRRTDDGSPRRAPSSGETQFEWGCRQGYITKGC